jgi:hypothetical protein
MARRRGWNEACLPNEMSWLVLSEIDANCETNRLLRNSRKTGAVSSVPPQGLASSSTVWRRASAPFALLRFCETNWGVGFVFAFIPRAALSPLAGPDARDVSVNALESEQLAPKYGHG